MVGSKRGAKPHTPKPRADKPVMSVLSTGAARSMDGGGDDKVFFTEFVGETAIIRNAEGEQIGVVKPDDVSDLLVFAGQVTQTIEGKADQVNVPGPPVPITPVYQIIKCGNLSCRVDTFVGLHPAPMNTCPQCNVAGATVGPVGTTTAVNLNPSASLYGGLGGATAPRF